MPEVLIWTLVAVVATAIVWHGSGLLERASERLAAYYQLPDIVQGAIVVAVGSSFPELSTTVISTLVHGEFELGVAAIVGSALFNILVIPALSGLASREQLQANRDLVYKEAQFYMIAVAVLTLTFSFAVIYQPLPDIDGVIRGELTRPMALMPVALYGLYLFVQYQDTIDYKTDVDTRDIRPGREWSLLALSLVVIVIGVEGLVRSAINFGDIFGTPSFLWGITVVAAGTSVPDAFVSIRAARHGRGITSIANVLGSNTFDLLVAIPTGVLIAGTAVINFSIAAPMMAVLTAATVVLFLMMRTQMVLSRCECVALLMIYVAFLAWIGVETFGMLDLVPSLPPAA
ncbi:sodium:calcium antiporter [Halomonas sp. 11-S5]|uniref:sodium:calcium antiporter n=1 Tax=Halomonas sp. 11-S5 TaxID=2994064 RepID=UPI0024688BE6|nr:sodium:calcium antiporter [Halomonas sp. 11-S5]